VHHDGPPEVEAGPDAGHVLGGAGAELLDEQRVDILGPNAAGRQLVAVSRLGQKWLASQLHGSLLDRFFEREMLKGMQRVVVDEDADRPLGWQQVRQSIEDAYQRVVRSADIFPHRESKL